MVSAPPRRDWWSEIRLCCPVQAASYIRRCDLECTDYLERLDRGTVSMGSSTLAGYPLSVTSSLALSLERIQRESPSSREVVGGARPPYGPPLILGGGRSSTRCAFLRPTA